MRISAPGLLGLTLGLLASFLPQQDPERTQDPVRVPKAPAEAAPLPPILDPGTVPVPRADLLTAFAPPTGYEGFYRLVAVNVGGRVIRDGLRGYLAVGRRHLALQIVQAGEAGRPPMIQSGVRTYGIEDGKLVTSSLIGFDNMERNALRFEPLGLEEVRGLERTPTALRVVQDPGSYMEFVRIE